MNKSDVLVILEAMKMEHELRAEADGAIKEIRYAAGEIVNAGDLPWSLTPLPTAW